MLSKKEKKEIDDKIPKPLPMPPFPVEFAQAYHDHLVKKLSYEEIFKLGKGRCIKFKKIKH